MHMQLADEVAEIILGAINVRHADGEHQPIRAVLAPFDPVGSTLDVGFNTSSDDLHAPNPLRSHINWIVCDGGWERNLAERLDTHPRVIAYAKNHGLMFEVPYRSGTEPRRYRPDYIVRVDDGRGGEVNLVLEVKGFRDHDAMLKATTMRQQWVPGVNRLGRFGRWAFAELREIHDFGPALDAAIAEACGDVPA
jgi:type III restriction enzyme